MGFLQLLKPDGTFPEEVTDFAGRFCKEADKDIIRNLKEQGEPLILISHNMRQVMDLVDRIIVFRRGRIVANLNKNETDGQDVVAYITGAKTGDEYLEEAV